MSISVILHNLRSMHNVGSIFRTADAGGVEKIYLCGFTPAPVDVRKGIRQQIAKVALGAEEIIPWEKCKSTARLISRLKKQDYTIVAIEQHKKAISYSKLKLSRNKKVALILGPEVDGLTETILEKADTIVEIPMHGKKESLNVSVAFGIVLFRYIHT